MEIQVKVLTATVDQNDKVTIVVGFYNGEHRWKKTYLYTTTKVIQLDVFKNRVKKDVANDLKIKTQLDQILPIVGKKFIINI